MPLNCISRLIFLTLMAIAGQQSAYSAQQDAHPAPQAAPEIDETLVEPAPTRSSLPGPVPANRPIIGLALEGAAALGLAHFGVILWLEDHHIPIDRIAGSSMGALIGAIYASGHTSEEMRAIATSKAFTDVFATQIPYVDSSFRRRQDRRQNPAAVTLGLAHGTEIPNAIFTDRGLNQFLVNNLLGYNRTELDFDRMPIPFRCVATDLNTLKAVTFNSGPLQQAVRASVSLPGIFPPVRDPDGHFLVDGGIIDDLPTDVLRGELKAHIVIAVRVDNPPLRESDVSSIVGVLARAFSAGTVKNVDEAQHLADVVIRLPVGNFPPNDYSQGAVLIQAGYQATEANKAALLRYALNEKDWAAFTAAREQRRSPKPGTLRKVLVDGGEVDAQKQVLRDLKPLEAEPISTVHTIAALDHVESNGAYSATFQTFASPPASGNVAVRAGATSAKNENDDGILVHLNKDRTGPPFLLIAPDVTAETSNITRTELNLRIIDQDLGGYGSELRANADLGYMTVLNAQYYRLLNPNGFFVQPSAGIVREPVYIWANQKRVAERLLQNLDGGVQVGRTIGNTAQISAEWRVEDTRWSLTTGAGGGPYISGTAQEGLLHFDIDRETSGLVSPSGFRFNAAAGALYHAVDSANAPVVMLSAAHTWAWGQKNIVGLTGDINSYLRTSVAEPYLFTLGGPRRLAASSFDEYRGTDTALARTAYLRRLASLPFGLGQGIYGMAGYEAGEIWSRNASTILRQDVNAGVVAATPLGSITVGGAAGDAGHRKFFITVGRLF